MHVIVCVDNQMGMQFHHRRQSRDSALMDRLLKMTQGRQLLISPISQKLFSDFPNLIVSEDFLSQAGPEDFCFVEDRALENFEDQIQSLILCKWNRDYPADLFLSLDLTAFHLTETTEFPGTSHEKITIEVYRKC